MKPSHPLVLITCVLAVLLQHAGTCLAVAPFSTFNLTTVDGESGFSIIENPAEQIGALSGVYVYRDSIPDAGCDLNNDGIDDLVVSAIYDDANKGRVYIIFGRNVAAEPSNTFPAVVNVSDISMGVDGKNGVVLYNTEEMDRYFGQQLRCVPDLNGDGIDDLIIRTPRPTVHYYVVFGHNTTDPWPASVSVSGSALTGQNGFTIDTDFGDDSAYSFMAAADLNADSHPEVFFNRKSVSVAISGTDYGNNGAVYMLWGRPTWQSRYNMSDIDATLSVPFYGAECGDGFAVLDMNEDGIDDLAIACSRQPKETTQYRSRDNGAVYVLFGNPALSSLPEMNGGAVFSLSDKLNGTNGFGIIGAVLDAGGLLGWSMTTCDFNGDNKKDLAITKTRDRALVYVVFSRNANQSWPSTLQVNEIAAQGSEWGVLVSGDDSARYTAAIAGVGDIDGDGCEDLAIWQGSSSITHIVLGQASWPNGFNLSQQINSSRVLTVRGPPGVGSYWLSSADVNGDGRRDITFSDQNLGTVFVLLSNTSNPFPSSSTLQPSSSTAAPSSSTFLSSSSTTFPDSSLSWSSSTIPTTPSASSSSGQSATGTGIVCPDQPCLSDGHWSPTQSQCVYATQKPNLTPCNDTRAPSRSASCFAGVCIADVPQNTCSTSTCAVSGSFAVAQCEHTPTCELGQCKRTRKRDNTSCKLGSQSGMCQQGVCVTVKTATCSNRVKDGQETAMDCGGPQCCSCVAGRACAVSSDCESGLCVAGVCRAEGSVNVTMSVVSLTLSGTCPSKTAVVQSLSQLLSIAQGKLTLTLSRQQGATCLMSFAVAEETTLSFSGNQLFIHDEAIFSYDRDHPLSINPRHHKAPTPSSLSNTIYLSPALALLTMYYMHPELALPPLDRISEQPVFEGRETIEMYQCGDADQSLVEHATDCAQSSGDSSDNTGVIVAVTISSVLFVGIVAMGIMLFAIRRRSHQSPPSANQLQSSSTSPCDSTNKPSSSAPPTVALSQPDTTAATTTAANSV